MTTYSNDETNGSDTVYGVLLEDVDASTAAKEGLVVARDAIVIKTALVYPDGATTAQKKALLKGLEDRGIVARVTA